MKKSTKNLKNEELKGSVLEEQTIKENTPRSITKRRSEIKKTISSQITPSKFANSIKKLLSSKKAENIEVINTSKLTQEFDYMVIASADNKYHIQALIDEIMEFIYKTNTPVLSKDINPESGWVVIDLFHTIVHIMTPDLREYYSLERLWKIPK
ncbi:MAG: ribosome silencing factor [Spirochaetia bacterium]|nr:ribosome silencing factor [Spirochaetota bacterium]MCX8096331.1 ribosome silencing factor [Spirochaetota bacterium]MDW8112308.1 ribosome silencing factor [Spirochaetia bacterium]